MRAVGDPVAYDRAHVWHPYAPSPGARDNVLVTGAEGVHLELEDGRRVVDGMASWWSAVHGHRHPVLVEALRRQLDVLPHVMFGGLTHRPAVALAERLLAVAPGHLDRVFFCDSGSVSVEVAIKMAIQHWVGRGRPQRTRLLTVRGGYHGDTFGAMSICDPVSGMHHLFRSMLPEQLFAPRPPDGFDAPLAPDALEPMADLLARHGHEVAAVVLEPIVQGAGGMRFSSPAYLAGVRRLCDEHDVLLVLDEIATGFGRTGRMFACEHAGVAPDVLCLGKALTGGHLSMAATLCTAEVAAGVTAAGGALMHGPTFMANPLAAAVAEASVGLLDDGAWATQVAAIEAGLSAGLAPARDLPGVADVRVLGAIGVIEATAPVPPGAQDLLLERGVWLRPFGHLLYTLPPRVIGADDLGRLTSAMVAVAAGLEGPE